MSPLIVALAVLSAEGPRFIEDDFGRALAVARREKKLLFVDAWAPWCHTCIYLRQHVLSRPGFAAYQKDVVFAALDTEKPSSAAFLEKYPVDALPTLFFIEPATGRLLFKWLGSTDEAQMRALLDAARGGPGQVAEADGLFAAGQSKEAAQRYLSALKGAPAASQGRAVLSMLSALTLARSFEACAKTAVEQRAALETAGEQVNGVTWGLGCALELPESPARTLALATLAQAGRELLTAKDVDTALADDVSGLYEQLVEERTQAGTPVEAQALAAQWLAFLEGHAARAPTPQARAVFDPHRVAAALAAKVPATMVEPLHRSESELPLDYNSPARLALVFREMGRLDEALAAIDRALGKCLGGPRKLRLYDTKMSILEKQGQVKAKAKVLGELVAYARRLPTSQLSPERLAMLERRLTEAKGP